MTLPVDTSPVRVGLNDGVLWLIGVTRSHFVNTANGAVLLIPDGLDQEIERFAGGEPAALPPELLEPMEKAGMLTQSPRAVDGVLLHALRGMDAPYVGVGSVPLSARARRAYELVVAAHARRRRFFLAAKQWPVLPETALRRALLVGDSLDVGRRRVLCIGDDDLVSIALAALGHEVVSWDIDTYLLSLVRSVAAEAALSIETAEVDVRNPQALAEERPFDVFLTDPVSSRGGFEVFLSRGLALLAPDGRGFVAVCPPMAGLFEDVAARMALRIVDWQARFNRYYSEAMVVDRYESDWVEVRATPSTRPVFAAEEFCAPPDFYRESFYLRRPTSLGFIDQIDDGRFATPLFLDLLVDVWAQMTGVTLLDRQVHAGDGWSLVSAILPDGYLTLHVDRTRHQIRWEIFPRAVETETVLRDLLLSAYKTTATRCNLSDSPRGWDFRLV